MNPASRLPSLIQRVTFREKPSEHQKGIDSLFSFDYMGSSEFEWGALPGALRAMRETKNKDWTIRSITVGKFTAHYVGSPDTFTTAVALFEDQLKERGTRKGYTKEFTRILETYLPPDPKDKFVVRDKFDGWWAIDGRPTPFALFKNKAHAEAFLGAL